MGQLVAVTEKQSTTPGVVRFEINRTLSGSGHERFDSVDDAYGDTPSDELARQMFATGQVDAMHVYANIITVDIKKGHDRRVLKGHPWIFSNELTASPADRSTPLCKHHPVPPRTKPIALS